MLKLLILISFTLILFTYDQELDMKELCVILAVSNLYLAFAGNVLSVPTMIYVLFVTMVTNITYDTDFLESQLLEVKGLSFHNSFYFVSDNVFLFISINFIVEY